jgi:hypothetical protein
VHLGHVIKRTWGLDRKRTDTLGQWGKRTDHNTITHFLSNSLEKYFRTSQTTPWTFDSPTLSADLGTML